MAEAEAEVEVAAVGAVGGILGLEVYQGHKSKPALCKMQTSLLTGSLTA